MLRKVGLKGRFARAAELELQPESLLTHLVQSFRMPQHRQ